MKFIKNSLKLVQLYMKSIESADDWFSIDYRVFYPRTFYSTESSIDPRAPNLLTLVKYHYSSPVHRYFINVTIYSAQESLQLRVQQQRVEIYVSQEDGSQRVKGKATRVTQIGVPQR